MFHPRIAPEGGFMGSGDGAGDGVRTRDINLGKVALYQLSYSRAGLFDILE